MPITKKDFENVENKVITLMGMSGVGKTYLSLMLANQGWLHYSCDLEIGVNYLRDEIEKALGEDNKITAADLSQLSRYVGEMGQHDGVRGLSFNEFKQRQDNYIKAECQTLRDIPDVVTDAIENGHHHIVVDSTGSICEIDDYSLLDKVDEHSLFVYIKANEEEEKRVLERAQAYPKPMYFSPEKFEAWVEEYKTANSFTSTDEFDGKDFARWVFPKLFKNRLPKYQQIADKYGVTIPSEAFQGVKTSDEFMDVITEYLPDEY